jgi:hypothetical protein
VEVEKFAGAVDRRRLADGGTGDDRRARARVGVGELQRTEPAGNAGERGQPSDPA